MSELPPFPSALRASLPPEAQAYLKDVEKQVVSLHAQVTTLQRQVEKLSASGAERAELVAPTLRRPAIGTAARA